MTAPAIHVAYSRWKKQVTARAYIWENGFAHTYRTKTEATKPEALAAVMESLRDTRLMEGSPFPATVVDHGFKPDMLKHTFGPVVEARR